MASNLDIKTDNLKRKDYEIIKALTHNKLCYYFPYFIRSDQVWSVYQRKKIKRYIKLERRLLILGFYWIFSAVSSKKEIAIFHFLQLFYCILKENLFHNISQISQFKLTFYAVCCKNTSPMITYVFEVSSNERQMMWQKHYKVTQKMSQFVD